MGLSSCATFGHNVAVRDGWDPDQYNRFKAERRQPFDDLVALCRPLEGGTAVDLGCGTGELTAQLHGILQARRTTGIDTSAAMLAQAAGRAAGGLGFERGNLAAWDGPAVDLVFANASFHWVPDHRGLLARVRRGVNEGGQLAFGIPANFSHPSHTVARAVAAETRFKDALGGAPERDQGANVLGAAAYAELLHALGASEQHVRLEVYGHELASTDEVVEWVKGTLLTPYRERLDEATFAAYLERYRERLLDALGEHRPYFYAFPRILAWARFG
jgi:trans-aconitate 2-methyltransferase